MKRSRFLSLLLILAVVFLVAACGGSKEPLVEKPASQINLSLDDLGPGWKLTQEQSDLKALGVKSSAGRDANMRFYQGANPAIQTISFVMVAKSTKLAEKEMTQSDFADQFISGMQAQIPEMKIQEVDLERVGDDQKAFYGSYEALGLNLYTLVFRKQNVVAMVMLMGPKDIASEEALLARGRTIASRAEVD